MLPIHRIIPQNIHQLKHHHIFQASPTHITTMPPGRPRKSASSSTKSQPQKPLTFGPNSNKITKPSLTQSSKLSKNVSPSPSLEKAITTELDSQSTTEADDVRSEQIAPTKSEETEDVEAQRQKATLAIRKSAPSPQISKTKGPSAIEEKASKIPETQIRKYWQAKESERIAPRVHQQGLSLNEKILRHFDLSSQFGVCSPSPPVALLTWSLRSSCEGAY